MSAFRELLWSSIVVPGHPLSLITDEQVYLYLWCIDSSLCCEVSFWLVYVSRMERNKFVGMVGCSLDLHWPWHGLTVGICWENL